MHTAVIHQKIIVDLQSLHFQQSRLRLVAQVVHAPPNFDCFRLACFIFRILRRPRIDIFSIVFASALFCWKYRLMVWRREGENFLMAQLFNRYNNYEGNSLCQIPMNAARSINKLQKITKRPLSTTTTQRNATIRIKWLTRRTPPSQQWTAAIPHISIQQVHAPVQPSNFVKIQGKAPLD
jgi:hypothetical protein